MAPIVQWHERYIQLSQGPPPASQADPQRWNHSSSCQKRALEGTQDPPSEHRNHQAERSLAVPVVTDAVGGGTTPQTWLHLPPCAPSWLHQHDWGEQQWTALDVEDGPAKQLQCHQ